jgi:hypothetical protein
MGSANNNQSISFVMDIEMGTSLSLGQDVNVLSNDDALHSEYDACSEDARITKELNEDAFPPYYNDTIKRVIVNLILNLLEMNVLSWAKNIKSSC